MQSANFRLTVCVLVVFLLSGCGKKPQEAILGKWESSEGLPITLIFNPDGTMKLLANGREVSSLTKYQCTDKGIVEAGDDKQPNHYRFTVQFKKGELIVTGSANSFLLLGTQTEGMPQGTGKPIFFPPSVDASQRFRPSN